MKNAKTQLKRAIKKTTTFMLKIEENSSARVPEWYEQMALSSENEKLNDKIYKTLLEKLKQNLNKEFGSTATKFILN
jgi:bisphosphoglycerate-dependent phosphoglycerate mutase